MTKKPFWRHKRFVPGAMSGATPTLAMDWSDDTLILAWRSSHPIGSAEPIDTVRYPLPPGWVVEGQIKAPQAIAKLIRQVLDEHDWQVTQAVVALGAPLLTHHWITAHGHEPVPTSPELRALIDQISPAGVGFGDTAYVYDARREPILASTLDQALDQSPPRWWLVAVLQSVVETLQAMFRWCDLSLVRIDVRASVLYRFLSSKKVLKNKCCIIDQHGAFTEWWVIDQGKITDLQSYSHARLSEAEQAQYLGERLAMAVTAGSIESVWVSQPLGELMQHMLSQAMGITPKNALDQASTATAITRGLLH